MSSLNKALIIGRLGRDPEVKYTPDGTAVCRVSVATSESWKDKDGNKQERTEWHRIVMWRRLAEICGQYLHKGSLAYFEGQIQTREWEKDGDKRYSTEIVVKYMQILESRRSDAGSSGRGAAPGATYTGPVGDDDVPF